MNLAHVLVPNSGLVRRIAWVVFISGVFSLAWSTAGVAETWEEEARLLPADGQEGDSFGKSVGIFGDWAIIGAEQQVSGVDPGAVYMYQRTDSGWLESTKLMASDAMAGDLFGGSVAITDDRAVVGARKGNPFGDRGPGAAYVFQKSKKNSWRQVAVLSASDEDAQDWFGWSVDLWADTAIVGAWRNEMDRGAAYVFQSTDTGWSEQAKLVPSDGQAGDSFGFAVSASSDVAIVGASGADGGDGAAYVFDFVDGQWREGAKLTSFVSVPDDGPEGLQPSFGASVSIYGDRAIVGARGDNSNGMDAGAAYIFERSGAGWTSAVKLSPDDAQPGDLFGWSVGIWGDRAIVGSRRADDDEGAAYVFELLDSGWTQVAKLTGSDGGQDQFGYSIDLAGNQAVMGAWRDDENGSRAGSAYVLAVPEPAGLLLAVTGLGVLLVVGRRVTVHESGSGSFFGA